MRYFTLTLVLALSIWTTDLFAQEDKTQSTPEPSTSKQKTSEQVTSTPARPSILTGIKRCFKKMTQQEKQTSPWGMSYGVASPAQGPAPTQGPCTPWYGYGLGVPTYSYGWFGATYRPTRSSHSGYYNNYDQWTYRRGH